MKEQRKLAEYDSWIEKIKEASEIHEREENGHLKKEEEESFSLKPYLPQALIVFFLAFFTRIIYMFFLSDPNIPGWYTDVYHHWQIAYLSKEIGFSHGFLRLWDFKGMEFFWGLLHPLVLVILFTLTGSISILVPRLLSTFGGSVSIVFLFLLTRRYFNSKASWAVAIFASFFPLAVFSNTSGMQEELGMPLILGGLLLWPSFPSIIGILFALASMVRSEYWIFTFGLIMAGFILKLDKSRLLVVLLSYSILILAYMKYLVNWTGNYIFPVYLNFIASAKGEWFANLPIVGEKLLAKEISQGIFAFGVIGAVLTLIKKPKYGLFFLFGFGNIIFIGFMVGFGAYARGYIRRFWVDRLYNWPYIFVGILLILLLFYCIPKKFPLFDKLKINWIFLLIGVITLQQIWQPIKFFMKDTKAIYISERQTAEEIAKAYKGGTVLLPEDRPNVTYFLAHDFGIKGRNMQGQMFDPFFYFPDKNNLFNNWGEDRKRVLNWLKKDNIKLIVLTHPKPSYMGLIKRESKYFRKMPSKTLYLYEVVVN